MRVQDPLSQQHGRWWLFVFIGVVVITAVTSLLFVFPNQAASTLEAQALNQSSHLFQANLTGAEETTPVDTQATGRVVLALDGNTLYYRLTVSNIVSATMGHIHEAPAGVDGPISHWLFDAMADPLTGDFTFSGSWSMSSDDLDALMAGDLYVNVHTSAYPGGEIRGQIVPFMAPTHFSALMDPEQEVPHTVVSDALGAARLTLVTTDTLHVEMAVTDIVSITMAHIHTGWPGDSGPPVHWLYDVTGSNAPGGPFGPGQPVSHTVGLNAEDIVDLLTGYYYINIHTDSYPAGEVRGQIGGSNVFQAALNGAEEVPPVHTRASGKALMALDRNAETLYYRLLVQNIDDITMAHIHLAPSGVNGPVVYWLYDPSGQQAPGGDFDAANPVAGSISLTYDDLFDLMRGDWYVNIHTTGYPAGEIRGQIWPHEPPDHLNALLTGAEEVPPVATDAVGVTRFTLDTTQDILHYDLLVRDIVSITMAHIHTGWPGENGPPVHWLYHNTGQSGPGGDFDPDNPIGGGLPLTAENMVDLLTGYYYVNVHTETHSAGEIRGQIGGVHLFEALMSGEQEVPPVDTDASGNAVLALTPDTGTLYYRLMVSDIMTITQAHIHLAPMGQNGGVVHWLYDVTGQMGPGGDFDPDNPVAGSLTLTTTEVFDLIAGDYYINVHTTAHPAGEIRGQIWAHVAGPHYRAALSGDEEVPPVSTDASGLANFTLYAGLDSLHYFVQVSDIMSITMAHIHTGWPGENGPPVHWLYHNTGQLGPGGDFDPDNPIGGCLLLDAENMVDLLTGYYYVNVHTDMYPGGEIRGQIEAHEMMLTYLPIIFRD
ncbi:MAG: CHRD domain-containing protein [Chloroflexota bacterium]|jgi:hypothetical protein